MFYINKIKFFINFKIVENQLPVVTLRPSESFLVFIVLSLWLFTVFIFIRYYINVLCFDMPYVSYALTNQKFEFKLSNSKTNSKADLSNDLNDKNINRQSGGLTGCPTSSSLNNNNNSTGRISTFERSRSASRLLGMNKNDNIIYEEEDHDEMDNEDNDAYQNSSNQNNDTDELSNNYNLYNSRRLFNYNNDYTNYNYTTSALLFPVNGIDGSSNSQMTSAERINNWKNAFHYVAANNRRKYSISQYNSNDNTNNDYNKANSYNNVDSILDRFSDYNYHRKIDSRLNKNKW
jgi:hypothetical protein